MFTIPLLRRLCAGLPAAVLQPAQPQPAPARAAPSLCAALLAATLGTAFGLTAGAGAARAEELKLLMPWTQDNERNWQTVEVLGKRLEELSAGRLTLKVYDSTVVPSLKQLQPVSAGAFDLNYTSPGYHADATSIGSLGDTVNPDPEKRRSSGLFDTIDRYYQSTQNVKVLCWAGKEGYQFLLKHPVGADGGLAGLKIRGNPAYAPIIAALGGTNVTLPASEIYPSLQKGLIDGSAWTQSSLVSSRYYEVVGYMARPTFGTSTLMLLMNLDKFESLSPEDQAVMVELGQELDGISQAISQPIIDKDTAGMLDKGVQFSSFSPAYADRINQIFNEGVWERTIAQEGAVASKIIDEIKAAGMAQDQRG